MVKETSDFNQSPANMRLTISFFGRRNAGKSSLINAITGQNLSIISDVPGTTTDPVKKAMELLPLGPVTLIDTPGLDDLGKVGELRIVKAYEILNKTDLAILVVDVTEVLLKTEKDLINNFKEKKISFVVVLNKTDCNAPAEEMLDTLNQMNIPYIEVSALTLQGIPALKGFIAKNVKPLNKEKILIRDKIKPTDIILLVTPIDESAPKGRIILPQVQTIRDILDTHACCMLTQPDELLNCLSALRNPPALVITDSQVFEQVNALLPPEIPLTSFSILFARLNGILKTAVQGANMLDHLNVGDKILISEGCTHHRQCEDIGTVKIPNWIEQYTGKKFTFSFTSGNEFPQSSEELSQYKLIIHCGGCMLTQKDMLFRMNTAKVAQVPFTNYGTLIAKINGILDKSLQIFNL